MGPEQPGKLQGAPIAPIAPIGGLQLPQQQQQQLSKKQAQPPTPSAQPPAAPSGPPQTAAAAAAAAALPTVTAGGGVPKFSSIVGGTGNPGQQQRIASEQRRQEAARNAPKGAVKADGGKRIDAVGGLGGKGMPPASKNGMAQVKLRGLPYGATTQDVASFFRGFGAVENSIQFGFNSDGRPSGEAWVSFTRLEDARRAVREKDRNHMGDRYVELFLLNEGGGVASRYK
jgi:hypothetical protein